MNRTLRSTAALGMTVLCAGGCTGAYVTTQLFTDGPVEAYAPAGFGRSSPTGSHPNYSCSATDCSLGMAASNPAYPPMTLAVAKTTTIIALTDDPVTGDDTRPSSAEQ